MDHLDVLELRLSHERERYRRQPNELRKVWIEQIEREIADVRNARQMEDRDIGINVDAMTDDQLLLELLKP